jgi:hypothetical protein
MPDWILSRHRQWRASMVKTMLLIVGMALTLAFGSACAPIAAYEVSHPEHYRFPGGGGGGGGGNGG